MLEEGRGILDGAKSLVFDGEAEFGSNSYGAHHAEGIFIETFKRVAHGADKVVLEILPAVIGVNELPSVFRDELESHGVDGKVATGEVFFQSFSPVDVVGMSTVGVPYFFAEGGDVEWVSRGNLVFEADGTEFVIIEAVGEDFQYFFRSSICSEVPIEDGAVGDKITNGASDDEDLISGRFKLVYDV